LFLSFVRWILEARCRSHPGRRLTHPLRGDAESPTIIGTLRLDGAVAGFAQGALRRLAYLY